MKKASGMLLCAVLLAGCAGTETKVEPPPPVRTLKAERPSLAQKVSFSFKHEKVGSALRTLTVLTEVDISVRPEVVLAKELEKRTVTLTVNGMPLKDALDWLVRETGGYYQVGDKGCVWITKEYIPIDKMVTDSVPVAGLFAEVEAADLAAILKASVLTVGVKRDVVLGALSGRNLMVAQAPGSAMGRIKDVVASLADRKAPPAMKISKKLEPLLKKKVLCNFGVTSLGAVIGKLRAESGLNIGYRQTNVDARTVRRTFNMDAGHITVREVLDILVALTGFDRWELEPDRGVWLYSQGEARHPTSGEVPWLGTVVRSYPAREIVERMEARRLENAVRAVCGPASSSTLVKYSEATGKLLVIEEPRVITRVEEYLGLARLLSRKK
jgi:hypothetical protein